MYPLIHGLEWLIYNLFRVTSALASLDQETAAASPPSNPPSPALTKATPATEQPKPDDK